MTLPLNSLHPAPTGNDKRLLDGVRILDLTTSIAGPYATLMLSDLGADVIKVERPGTGDDTRAWGPPFLEGHSLWYLGVNRNKQSITLDYSSAEGLAVLHGLVRTCDVVILNLVPRVQSKLGVDHEALRAIRNDIVFCSITGFGLEGQRANQASYDLIAEGYSGIMDLTGEADSPPQKVGAPAADMLAGMDAAMAIIAALFDRQRSGMGHTIDISMVESMTRFLTPRLMTYLGSGEVPRRTGAKDSVIAVYQSFDTADLPLTLGLGNDRIWQRFWAAVGDAEFANDPRFSTNAKRHALRPEIVTRIQDVLLGKKRDEWLPLLQANGIPCGPINRIDEIAADEELARRGFFYRMDMNGTQVPQVGLGITIDGAAPSPRHAPPALSEHTAVILRNLVGLDDEQINDLRNKSII